MGSGNEVRERMKKTFYTELAYLFGILALALGSACFVRADFGMSMVVAPSYLLHLKVSEFLPFFTFGMAEYTFQAMLLVLLGLVLRKFKISFLFSFFTAVFYGFTLDGMMFLVGFLPWTGLGARLLFFAVGTALACFGVSMVFHTYLPPEAYELVVKEIAGKFKLNINRCKTMYDCSSCLLAVVMSFVFYGFGHFEAFHWGTVVSALINGTIIGWVSGWLEKRYEFRDGWKLRKWFA